MRLAKSQLSLRSLGVGMVGDQVVWALRERQDTVVLSAPKIGGGCDGRCVESPRFKKSMLNRPST
jgi:hypothetical protein